jgi:hypothetical protein
MFRQILQQVTEGLGPMQQWAADEALHLFPLLLVVSRAILLR